MEDYNQQLKENFQKLLDFQMNDSIIEQLNGIKLLLESLNFN